MKKLLSLIYSFITLSTINAGLPGRIDQNEVAHAKFGECEIFFYMDEEKTQLSKDFIESVNNDMSITLGQAAFPCPTWEIMVQAIKFPDLDPKGTEILANYAKSVHQIAEKNLGLNINGLSWYMNLNLNWEALKIHHDQFGHQYTFMQHEALSPKDYTLVQDLTLMDWQMGRETVAGTMVQDGRYGDRYIITLFPNEIVGTFYTEAAYQLKHQIKDIYPGHITMPPHSTIAPMDLSGDQSCGSSKGKRMSTAVRGIVPTEQITLLRERSQKLSVNRRTPHIYKYGHGAHYPNQVQIRPLSDKFTQVSNHNATFLHESQGLTYYQLSIEENAYNIEHIADVFDISIENTCVKLYRLTKKDNGFSNLSALKLPKDFSGKIIFVNSSSVPAGYRYFNIAQRDDKKGLPWIQLYELLPGQAMEIPHTEIKSFALSPCEELIYRNETSDAMNDQYSELLSKVVTHIDIFIFEPANGSR